MSRLKRIPIAAAQRIAEAYGYDQVIIYARKVGDGPAPRGAWMTTYSVTPIHCDVSAPMGKTLQRFMGWDV
jgi:hypothetical protein